MKQKPHLSRSVLSNQYQSVCECACALCLVVILFDICTPDFMAGLSLLFIDFGPEFINLPVIYSIFIDDSFLCALIRLTDCFSIYFDLQRIVLCYSVGGYLWLLKQGKWVYVRVTKFYNKIFLTFIVSVLPQLFKVSRFNGQSHPFIGSPITLPSFFSFFFDDRKRRFKFHLMISAGNHLSSTFSLPLTWIRRNNLKQFQSLCQ